MTKKSKKKLKAKVKPKPKQWDLNTFMDKYANAIALGIFFVLIFIFFYDVLFNENTFMAPDTKAPTALSKPLNKALWENHSYPQWMPYIFSGMPSFGSLMFTPFVYIPYLMLKLIHIILPLSGLFNHIVHYPLAGIGVFIFLRSKGVNFWGGLVGGITFMFTPFLITMEVFGHGGQMMTATYIPLAIWAVDQLLQKRNLLYLGIVALVIGLQLQRGHVQIVYYTWMAIGLYALYFFIRKWRIENEIKGVLKSLTHLSIALALAFGLAAILYFSIYEYTPYSIRGGGSAAKALGGGGVGFDYATQWSFHPKEMLTFLMPSFFGFGGQTYWGAMPFTDYPNYMGILPLLLAIFAFVYKRRVTTGYFATLIIISLMISFGKHFSPLYNLLYNYLPFFNKFRVPVMILILVQFSVAVLAGMGFQNLIELTQREVKEVKNNKIIANKIFKISALVVAVLVGLVLIGTLFKDAFFKFMSSLYPIKYQLNVQQQLNQLRFDMLMKDMWIMILFLGVGLALIWWRMKRNLRTISFGLILAFLTLIDLWIVDYKLNKPVPEKSIEAYLSPDETINFLKQDKDLFRIFPLQPLFGENRWAAHEIATIGGYYPAKLKLYQNFMDHLNLANGFASKYYRAQIKNGQESYFPLTEDQLPQRERQVHLTALNMLNVKYIVTPFQIPEPDFVQLKSTQMIFRGQLYNMFIYQNNNFLPRAFLIGNIQVVANEDAAMEILKSGEFDPSRTAILEETPEITPQSKGEGSVQITEYQLNKIKIKSSTDTAKLLVLSEIYYPKGWKAYIDGQPTKIYKTNYMFRSVMVPAGSHEVEFNFDSAAFKAGLTISGISWFTVLAILGLGIVQRRKRKDLNLN
ncbi:MAG: YfhO family protein [bacterium]